MMGKVNNKCYGGDAMVHLKLKHNNIYLLHLLFCLETYELVLWVPFLNSSTTVHNLKDIGKKHTSKLCSPESQ